MISTNFIFDEEMVIINYCYFIGECMKQLWFGGLFDVSYCRASDATS